MVREIFVDKNETKVPIIFLQSENVKGLFLNFNRYMRPWAKRFFFKFIFINSTM